MLLLDISKLVKCLFNCRISIKKSMVRGLLTRLKIHGRFMWKVSAKKVVATVEGVRNDNKCKQKTCFKPEHQYLSAQNYL